jgi:glycosyltransferase involved in cell wall biosynthesis
VKLCILGDAGSVHIKRWIQYFVDQEWEVHLISLEKSIGTVGYEHILDSKINTRWLKYPLSSGEASRKIREMNPDIVNAHFVPNYGLIAALIGRHPLIISCWGSDILEPPRKGVLRKLRIRYALRQADFVTADGEDLVDEAVQYGVPETRCLNVPMGVDARIFSPPSQKESPPVVTHLRDLEPIYNPQVCIKAFTLAAKKEKIKAVMLGEGSMREAIERVATSGKLKIQFVPRLCQSDVAETLRRTAIYVSTSTCDSTSVTLLEAMACGAFPVVTDMPGNREWIEDGVNGYLIPCDDPDYVAKKIVDAIHDPELLKSAADRNVRIIHERAVWKDNMEIVKQAFMRIAG